MIGLRSDNNHCTTHLTYSTQCTSSSSAGRLIVAGGYNGWQLASVEILDRYYCKFKPSSTSNQSEIVVSLKMRKWAFFFQQEREIVEEQAAASQKTFGDQRRVDPEYLHDHRCGLWSGRTSCPCPQPASTPWADQLLFLINCTGLTIFLLFQTYCDFNNAVNFYFPIKL